MGVGAWAAEHTEVRAESLPRQGLDSGSGARSSRMSHLAQEGGRFDVGATDSYTHSASLQEHSVRAAGASVKNRSEAALKMPPPSSISRRKLSPEMITCDSDSKQETSSFTGASARGRWASDPWGPASSAGDDRTALARLDNSRISQSPRERRAENLGSSDCLTDHALRSQNSTPRISNNASPRNKRASNLGYPDIGADAVRKGGQESAARSIRGQSYFVRREGGSGADGGTHGVSVWGPQGEESERSLARISLQVCAHVCVQIRACV